MEGQDKSRELELPYHGAQPTIPTELHMKLAFRVEAKGSGTKGTAPPFGPLLRACGMAEMIVATTSVRRRSMAGRRSRRRAKAMR